MDAASHSCRIFLQHDLVYIWRLRGEVASLLVMLTVGFSRMFS